MALNPYPDNGLPWRALAFSLLLHAILLLQPGLGATSSESRTARVLSAMLKSQTVPPPAKAEAPAPARRPAATHAHSHADAPPPIAAPAPFGAPTSTLAEPAIDASGKPAAESEVPAAHTVVGEPPPGLNFAEAKKSYLFAIAAEAGHVKKYPPRAFAAGWTGTAEIRVAVAAGGNVQAPQLDKSSGYADIDNAALSFVGLALKRTAVPQALRAREFEFLLPVSFTIEDR